uniref:Ovule protein n=1 Tax=Ascaris lumbricoides TaxID=6252 RepID=A0A0M3IHJ6_ASCLU
GGEGQQPEYHHRKPQSLKKSNIELDRSAPTIGERTSRQVNQVIFECREFFFSLPQRVNNCTIPIIAITFHGR